MAKALKFEKHTVTTLDNDGDEHETEVVSAVVTEDLAGQEVLTRTGESRVLRAGEVVVPAGGGKMDVFTAKEWDDMWDDSERVADHGGALRTEKVADDNEPVADDNEETNAPKDDVATSAPVKKAAASSGKRS